MTRYGTRSRIGSERPRRSLRRISVAACTALVCVGCVSAESYEIVLHERDQLLTERETLKTRVRVLETDKRRLETSNESLANERRTLLENVEGLRTQRKDLEKDVAALEQTKRSLGQELAKREGQLEERETLLEERAAELAGLGAQLEARNVELDARTRELQARDQEIERLKSAYEAFVSDLEAEIADGQVVIDQLREGMRVNLPDAQFFAPESVELTMHGKVTLAKVAAQLRAMPHQVEVQGHTDDLAPSPALAERLPSSWDVAGARAIAVLRQLVAHGIAPERIRAVSFGSSRPVAPNDTPEDRARNRRIEIRLIPVIDAPNRPLAATFGN